MEIKVQNIADFLKELSWVKIIQTMVFLTILGVFYVAWENRVIIYNSVKVGTRYESSSPLIIELGKNSKNYIDSAVDKSENLVGGIHVISVDFKKNSRIISYSSLSDANLRKSYDRFVENKIAPTPLFTNSEINNQRIINLINGEFTCMPMDQSLAGILFKGSATTIVTVCSISVPPYYGRFSGYMNIYLKRAPTDADAIFIRQLSRDIALRIYEIDINSSMSYIKE